jgi:hopanoid biosynthesis associated RND transporter like protein HpnN
LSIDAPRTERTWLVRWIDFVRRNAPLVLLVAVATAVASDWYAATHFSINTSTEDMLSDDLPFQQDKKELAEAFPSKGRALLVVIDAPNPDLAEDAAELLTQRLSDQSDVFFEVAHPRGLKFFKKNGLLYLKVNKLAKLSVDLAEAQPLLLGLWQDMSLRGLFDVLDLAAENTEGDEAVAVTPALDRISAVVEAVNRGDRAVLSWSELMSREDADKSDRRSFVIATSNPRYSTLTPGERELRIARKAARELGLTPENGYRVRLTGNMAMRYEEFKSLETSMTMISIITLVLVTFILIVGLRSVRLMIGTLFTLLVGLSWTAFFAMFAIGQLNIISVAFAVLFIGLSVDFGIHFTLRYREAYDAGATNADALSIAANGLAWPLLLCAGSTAIGFYAFLPTAYKGVSELGLIAGTGILFALFANLTVLPAYLFLFRPKPSKGRLAAIAGLRLQAFVNRNARPIVYGAAVIGAVSLVALPYVQFDYDPMNLRDPTTESVSTMLDLVNEDQNQRYDATILAPDLATAEQLEKNLEALPHVDRVKTIWDLIPKNQEQKLQMIEDMSYFLAPLLLPPDEAPPPSEEETRSLMAKVIADMRNAQGAPDFRAGLKRLADALNEYLRSGADLAPLRKALLSTLPNRLEAIREGLDAEEITLDALPTQATDRLVSADGRVRMKVYPVNDMRDRDQQRAFVEELRTVAPRAGGSIVTLLESGNAVVGAFKEAGAYATIVITVLLLVLLRSVRDTLLVLVPLLLAALLTMAATVVIDLPFNYANVIALPLILGLGVDSGIHLVMRRREQGSQSQSLLETSTPRAVLLSALTTICSFGALSLSPHLGTASMGKLLTVAVLLTLVCTLVVLPALMAWIDRGKAKSPPEDVQREEERTAAQ